MNDSCQKYYFTGEPVPVIQMEAELNDPLAIRALQQVISAIRKIGDDLVLSITSDQFAVRALNATRSALPIVSFKKTFFHSFMFKSRKDITYQLPANALITAFKNVSAPTALKIAIDADRFNIALLDKFNITHDWELFLSDAVLMTAPYDLNDCAVQIQCRYDVFDGLSDAFRGNRNIMLEVNQDGTMVLKSAILDELSLSSTMTIRRSDHCDIMVSDDIDQFRITFSVADFIVAVKIAKILNQRMCVYFGGPGCPIIIKASMPNQATFEMALATSSDQDEAEDDEDPVQPDLPTGSASSMQADTTPGLTQGSAQPSQVSPWPRRMSGSASTGETVPFPANPMYSAGADDEPLDATPNVIVVNPASGVSNRERMSQMIRQGMFSESPPFPMRKRMTGQYAEDSQPPSDESDSDM